VRLRTTELSGQSGTALERGEVRIWLDELEVEGNGDGVVCIKDWTGPDPDPLTGFVVIDNTGRHNHLP
jgi:hypothetical protein